MLGIKIDKTSFIKLTPTRTAIKTFLFPSLAVSRWEETRRSQQYFIPSHYARKASRRKQNETFSGIPSLSVVASGTYGSISANDLLVENFVRIVSGDVNGKLMLRVEWQMTIISAGETNDGSQSVWNFSQQVAAYAHISQVISSFHHKATKTHQQVFCWIIFPKVDKLGFSRRASRKEFQAEHKRI